MSDRPSPAEVPVNRLPINRLALRFLEAAKEGVNPSSLYLAQLAQWGLDQGLQVPDRKTWDQPEPQAVEELVGRLVLADGAEPAHHALRALFGNRNLEQAEQLASLRNRLERAGSPEVAAAEVLEVVYDLLSSRRSSRE